MHTAPVTIACCQVAPDIGEVADNLATIDAAVRDAAARGARIVVLPELANTGYVFEDAEEARGLAESVTGPSIQAWRQLSAELGIVLVAGFAESGGDGLLYNSAVLIDAGEVKSTYRKAHLWDREKLIFTAGDEPPPIAQTAWGRIGIMICYDLELPEWVRSVALRGADLLAAPVNWPNLPRPDGERPGEIVRVQADAAVNRMAVAACDRAGLERGQDWVGGTVIVDADGYPRSEIRLGETHTALAELGLLESRTKTISDHNDVHADRRPELYGDVSNPAK
jgi:predicted amidohydrolase